MLKPPAVLLQSALQASERSAANGLTRSAARAGGRKGRKGRKERARGEPQVQRGLYRREQAGAPWRKCEPGQNAEEDWDRERGGVGRRRLLDEAGRRTWELGKSRVGRWQGWPRPARARPSALARPRLARCPPAWLALARAAPAGVAFGGRASGAKRGFPSQRISGRSRSLPLACP